MTTPTKEDFNLAMERLAAESHARRTQHRDRRERIIRVMEWLALFGVLIIIGVTIVWFVLAFLAVMIK